MGKGREVQNQNKIYSCCRDNRQEALGALVPFLALVDAEYRFLLIDFSSSGSYSDAQIFNRSDLRQMIEDGTL